MMDEGGDFDPMLAHAAGGEGAMMNNWHEEFAQMPSHHHHQHLHQHQHQHFHQEGSWAEEMAAQHHHHQHHQHHELCGETGVCPGAGVEEQGSWLEQFEKHEAEEWVQDYTHEGVQTFTAEGEAPVSVEEKRAASAFYNFMGKINTGEIQFDENNQIVERPPQEGASTDMASDYLRSLEQQPMPGAMDGGMYQEFLEHQMRTNDEDDGAYDQAWNGGEEGENNWADMWARQQEGEFAAGNNEETEQWLEEFQKMEQQAQLANDGTYPFEENNPYLFHDTPFEEGVSLLHAGTLAAAALAFEAACQKDPYHFEAWHSLGTTQQENEKDPLAVLALRKAKELDPMNLNVHMGLAVSYTNEAQHANALSALRDWLGHNPLYAQIQPPPPQSADDNELLHDFFYVNPKDHREVVSMFEVAVQQNGGDAELFIALGILHNLSHEYDLAATDFERAVAQRPDDAKLWNKLGATLANGSRPREAIQAYNRALDLVPGYVRAQYNMGISMGNLGDYSDAIRQFLKALHMQKEGGAAGAEDDPTRLRYNREMWDVLRMTLHMMDRSDLVELTMSGDLKPLAAEFGLTLM
eukprot:PhM_4_TR18451/c1_g1_i1/m.17654/K13342/PEX5, PXR1; peroxin-5